VSPDCWLAEAEGDTGDSSDTGMQSLSNDEACQECGGEMHTSAFGARSCTACGSTPWRIERAN